MKKVKFRTSFPRFRRALATPHTLTCLHYKLLTGEWAKDAYSCFVVIFTLEFGGMALVDNENLANLEAAGTPPSLNCSLARTYVMEWVSHSRRVVITVCRIDFVVVSSSLYPPSSECTRSSFVCSCFWQWLRVCTNFYRAE